MIRQRAVDAGQRLVAAQVRRARQTTEMVLVGKEDGELVGKFRFTLEQQVAVGRCAGLDRLEIRCDHFIEPLFTLRIVS